MILDILGYVIFLAFVFLSAYLIYHLLTSMEERKIYRTRFKKQIVEQRDKYKKKQNGTLFEQRLKKSGIPISAYRYQVIRYSLVIGLCFYYLVRPNMSDTYTFTLTSFLIPVLIWITTEPKFNFSAIHYTLTILEGRRKRKKVLELLTLYSLLKIELSTETKTQKTNIYSFLRESQSMFDYINVTIIRFLSLWKSNPEQAKNVFYEDIETENAKALGEILIRIDNASKTEGLTIIENESDVFSYSIFEKEVQSKLKSSKLFFLFATFTVFMWLSWLIFIIFGMTNDIMNMSNF
jgi:hypothetical protein